MTRTPEPDLVCVSHLWWDWVWQRPQHLLARLARSYPTLYVEEPRILIGPPSEGFEVREVHPGVRVASLRLRSDAETFWRRLDETRNADGSHPSLTSPDITRASLMFESPQQPRLESEVRAYVDGWRTPGAPLVLWLYTPVVLQFIDLLRPDLVVYDVMDDLAAFRAAPASLLQKRRELLERADLVLTGGPSLYESTRAERPDAHLFPSGVEQEHFAAALRPDLPLPPELASAPRPIVGYYGVIDERTDLALLERVADMRPDWTWVMVGPIMKVEERALPRRRNIVYPGKQEYAELPAYLKAFDVAMMPFALNDATRSISPTKTLEYMAAHKPIVSTPIKDVADLYGSVVRIADGPEAFVGAIESALAETQAERSERVRREEELLSRYSWDGIADRIQALVDDQLARQPSPAAL